MAIDYRMFNFLILKFVTWLLVQARLFPNTEQRSGGMVSYVAYGETLQSNCTANGGAAAMELTSQVHGNTANSSPHLSHFARDVPPQGTFVTTPSSASSSGNSQ